MAKNKFLFSLMLLVTVLLPFSPALALDFDPNFIISDNDMDNFNSMSVLDIQKFLDNKPGILKTYTALDIDNISKKASEIIYNASQNHKMNPQFLLVLLQREQSLITNPSPSQFALDWAMGYGVCDDCAIDDPYVQLYKGFSKQIDRAAFRIRYYSENKAEETWIKRANEEYEIDGQTVIPLTEATANLYTYTPHILGNKNFFTIWNTWFIKQYPDGSLVSEVGDDKIWLIEFGQKRLFTSQAALTSRYDAKYVIKVPKGSLSAYITGEPIKFAQYSLLMSGSGLIYLVDGLFIRKIASNEVFRNLGFNPEEIIHVANSDVLAYKTGELITNDSIYPTGALLQNKETGGVYYVISGKKHPITTKDLLTINFPNRKNIVVLPEELEKYELDAPVSVPDGLLVSPIGKTSVYVISNGEKRPILSGEIFEELGYQWENVVKVSEDSLVHNPEGRLVDSITNNGTIASLAPYCSACPKEK